MFGSRTTLPEDLLLLCLDPRSLRVRRPPYFGYALAGAVLSELRLARAIDVRGGAGPGGPGTARTAEVIPLPALAGGAGAGAKDGPGPSHPGLDAALDWLTLSAPASRTPSTPGGLPLPLCLRRIARNAAGPFLDSLVEQGALQVDQHRVFGLIPRTSYRAESALGHQQRAARIDAVLRALPPVERLSEGASLSAIARSRSLDPRELRLCALAAAADLHHRLYPGREQRDQRRLLETLAERDFLSTAVRALHEADQTAATSAAATAVST